MAPMNPPPKKLMMRSSPITTIVFLFAALGLSPDALAEEGAEATSEKHGYAPLALDSPYMTGDWGGARTTLEEHGVVTQLYLNYTTLWNVGGGLANGGKPAATMDLLMHLDLGEMGLVERGRILGHFQRIMGSGVNPWIGSNYQVADDNDGEGNLYVAQLYYEHELIEKKLWMRLGFLDQQTVVDRNRFSNSEDKQFLSQALDNNPLLPLPESIGVELEYRPVDWFSIVGGVADIDERRHHKPIKSAFDGPDNAVFYLEPEFHVNFDNPWGPGKLEGNYRFGMLYDGEKHEIFERAGEGGERFEDRKGDDVGFYVSFDQDLFRENDVDAQGLGWFFRYGFRHGDISRISNYWSTGFSYLGPIPTRDKDTLGLAIFQNIPSDIYQSRVNPFAHDETVFEAYYSIHIADWLYITPDVQYISSPGSGDSIDDAVVVGVRTRISF